MYTIIMCMIQIKYMNKYNKACKEMCNEACTVLYCIVLYYEALYRKPIRPLSYKHSSGVGRNPHSTLAE